MIIEINNKNIDEFELSVINKKEVLNDLKSNPFGHYLCYVEKNKVIGYLYYSDIYERAEINQIEVEIIHRNCGIASKLMKKLTDSVEKSITLEVSVDNLSAIHLYEKFNFINIGIRKGYYDGVDSILMERK